MYIMIQLQFRRQFNLCNQKNSNAFFALSYPNSMVQLAPDQNSMVQPAPDAIGSTSPRRQHPYKSV